MDHLGTRLTPPHTPLDSADHSTPALIFSQRERDRGELIGRGHLHRLADPPELGSHGTGLPLDLHRRCRPDSHRERTEVAIGVQGEVSSA